MLSNDLQDKIKKFELRSKLYKEIGELIYKLKGIPDNDRKKILKQISEKRELIDNINNDAEVGLAFNPKYHEFLEKCPCLNCRESKFNFWMLDKQVTNCKDEIQSFDMNYVTNCGNFKDIEDPPEVAGYKVSGSLFPNICNECFPMYKSTIPSSDVTLIMNEDVSEYLLCNKCGNHLKMPKRWISKIEVLEMNRGIIEEYITDNIMSWMDWNDKVMNKEDRKIVE